MSIQSGPCLPNSRAMNHSVNYLSNHTPFILMKIGLIAGGLFGMIHSIPISNTDTKSPMHRHLSFGDHMLDMQSVDTVND